MYRILNVYFNACQEINLNLACSFIDKLSWALNLIFIYFIYRLKGYKTLSDINNSIRDKHWLTEHVIQIRI